MFKPSNKGGLLLMKCLKKSIVAALVSSLIVASSSWMVSANTSNLSIGGQQSVMTGTSDYSQIYGANHTYCYIDLTAFQFSGYQPGIKPTGNGGVYWPIMLFSYNPGNAPVLSEAIEPQVINSINGGGSYSYKSGYGYVGSKYRLRAYNNCGIDCYTTFYWFA